MGRKASTVNYVDCNFLRFCPGRDVALDFIFLVLASVNSIYHIRKTKDANGKVVDPAIEYEGLWLV